MNIKKQQLKKHKFIATSLFILMVVIYISMLVISKNSNQNWIGYIKAFSEAGMVGALADWFAVTALFKYPLGIKIPHTNLINNNKDALGENLGAFVSDNFLNQETIRPYITKIELSNFLVNWLSLDVNINKTSDEIRTILKDVILKLDEQTIVQFISNKGKSIINEINFANLASKGLFHLIENNEHQRLITLIIPEAKNYVENNKEAIYKKVVEKNPILGLIGGKAVTNQLISGIVSFLEEVQHNSNHSIRNEITSKLYAISESMKTDEDWKKRFEKLSDAFISDSKLKDYATELWKNSKHNLIENLENKNSILSEYIVKYLKEIRTNLQQNEETKNKINQTVHKFIYKLALRNSHEIGNIISKTVKEWDGQEMSNKLELEVGKDLQYIRINGTLVGGIVGLIIHSLSNLLA